MKLISMTDFVIKENTDPSGFGISLIESFRRCCLYSMFLKQPLELWMFVPCDENGNVLEEPNRSTHTDIECEQYKQAKERCLFEGFRLDGKYLWHKDALYMISEDLSDSLSKSNIEHLLLSHSKYEFELTPTAIKQLGL